jgi:hypothetical protein
MSAQVTEKGGVSPQYTSAGEKDAGRTEDRHIPHADNVVSNTNARLANPLEGIPHDQLMADASAFAKEHGLGHLSDEFAKGALIAQDPTAFENLEQLSEADKDILRRELTHRWDHPAMLYYMVILCSVAACVQGVNILALRA